MALLLVSPVLIGGAAFSQDSGWTGSFKMPSLTCLAVYAGCQLQCCHCSAMWSLILQYARLACFHGGVRVAIKESRSCRASWGLGPQSMASMCFVGQSKSQGQCRFKVRANRLHLLMVGVAVTLPRSMGRLVVSIFEDSLPHCHSLSSAVLLLSVLVKLFHKSRYMLQSCSRQTCLW